MKSFDRFMAISPDQWRNEMSLGNYDQAWSMVHYLVYADRRKISGAVRGEHPGHVRGKAVRQKLAEPDRGERCVSAAVVGLLENPAGKPDVNPLRQGGVRGR